MNGISKNEAFCISQVTEEAMKRVEKYWQQAIEELSAEDRSFLTSYFEGVPLSKLAANYQMSIENAEGLLRKIKRELLNSLKSKTVVRQ